jgi:hypothetical protein
MRIHVIAVALLASAAPQIGAQQRDTLRARNDSIAKVRADSIALVRELERMRGDTVRPTMGPQLPPVNPRLLPDVSAIADINGDLTNEGSTQEDGTRFGMREVEIAIGANVDPFFRADFILGLSDLEGIAIEEAYGTALALPYQLQARLGRFHMPVGKQNTTHRAELHTIEYPWVIQRFLGPEAAKGTGVWVSKIFAPLGFYQELLVTAVDRFGEAPEDLVAEEPPNKELGNLAYSARFRNYFDITEAVNLEISASAVTGKREQPFDFGAAPPAADVNAINARQATYGADVTFRWRPLQQGLYKSFIAQAEFMRQTNERVSDPAYLGPTRDFSGAYGFARWQLTRRLYLGGRYDWLQDPELNGETLTAASGYLEWFPSEFSKLVAAFERTSPIGLPAQNRVLLQATFAVGPHRPHPF